MCTFQYISDIHLELLDCVPIIECCAPYLLLAGDIGNLSSAESARRFIEFIEQVSAKFATVFLVAGNHEYYNTTINEGNASIAAAVKRYDNVVFLNNDAYHFPDSDISLFGGTFWTRIPPHQEKIIRERVNDYYQIIGLTPAVMNRMYDDACDALNAAKDHGINRRWIVMSHHIPRHSLVHYKYQGSEVTCAYASDIEAANDPRIVAWIYGHTHHPNRRGKFLCNPVGYKGENNNINWKATFTIQVPQQ